MDLQVCANTHDLLLSWKMCQINTYILISKSDKGLGHKITEEAHGDLQNPSKAKYLLKPVNICYAYGKVRHKITEQ